MHVYFKKIYTIRLKMFIKRVNFGVFLGSEHGSGRNCVMSDEGFCVLNTGLTRRRRGAEGDIVTAFMYCCMNRLFWKPFIFELKFFLYIKGILIEIIVKAEFYGNY